MQVEQSSAGEFGGASIVNVGLGPAKGLTAEPAGGGAPDFVHLCVKIVKRGIRLLPCVYFEG
jgi:hypothetical protein